MSSSISVCWGYLSLLWSGSLGISVHQHQWWCVLRDSWGILLIKAMIGSKCFRQSLRKSKRFFFLCLPLGGIAFLLFHLIVLVPFFSLQFVMDVDSLLQMVNESQDFGQLKQWVLSLSASFAWMECLQLSLGQGHSSEDSNKATITKLWLSRKKISSLVAAWGFAWWNIAFQYPLSMVH